MRSLARGDGDGLPRRFGFADTIGRSTEEWRLPDSQERFQQNLRDPDASGILAKNGWDTRRIEYRFNNHGFRSDDDFDADNPAPGIMFLGDSNTQGIGLNVEDTWAYKISRRMGGCFYNLGQGGTGIETQYRLMKVWAPLVRPRAIYTLGHMSPRREILVDGHGMPIVVGPWWGAEKLGRWVREVSYSVVEEALVGRDEEMVSSQRAIDAMCHVATKLGIPLYTATDDARDRAGHQTTLANSWARDLMHFGTAYHDEIARHDDNFVRVA